MASEAKRGVIRIGANYTRLIINVALGLILVPVMLDAAGEQGWALVALWGSVIGLGSMVQELVHSSLIRELGHAYHRDREGAFPQVYNTTLALVGVIALFSAGVFVVLWFLVPLFNIPDDLVSAARWLVITRGAETFLILVLAPPFNMYKVTERMVAYNFWRIVRRSGYLAAAVIVLLWPPGESIGSRVTAYAIISSGFLATGLLLSVAVIAALERGLLPRPSAIRRGAARSVVHTGGWNTAATACTMLHRRLAPLLMNLAFGLHGNLILGLAIQITVSVRRLTMGMTGGLDAVSARLSTDEGDAAVKTLWHHMTRLHGVAAFPTTVAILILAEPLLMLWLGKRIDDPTTTIPQASMLIRIMAAGMIARAISDSWIRILYGAGHVARYAWIIVVGALIHPMLFWVLLKTLPDPIKYTAIGWSYSAVFVIIHAGIVPMVGARAIGATYGDFYKPLVRPLVIALACSPILFLLAVPYDQYTVRRLVVAVSAYGIVFAAACILFEMSGAERSRFAKAALRRLPLASRATR